MTENTGQKVTFPRFSGTRCLMMPYIQGDPASVPDNFASYRAIIRSVYLKKGDLGFLTIDESCVRAGKPHRGARARYDRALHTEAGRHPGTIYAWGDGGGWGSGGGGDDGDDEPHRVTLDRDVKILLSSNLDDSCAVWNAEHMNTSRDGDIGYAANDYPYSDAILLKGGEIHRIGILTPHESLPVKYDFERQFLRIISSGVHGREKYFTRNPRVPFA